ncbi:MAG: hypothetical protein H7X88_08330, partial [Gloeobacteraceae cyanobacterium ES-bin-316]|nr:hypothetical protein [Ferruginibacter sp.]
MKKITGFLIVCLLAGLSQSLLAQDNWSAFSQKINAAPFAGKNFKMSGSIKTNGEENAMAMLFFRVDKKDKTMGFFDNMQDRPVNNTEWKQYEIQGTIDAIADSISFGGLAVGNGTYYFDDFSFLVEEAAGSWVTIPIVNNGFENTASASGLPEGWRSFKSSPKMNYSVSTGTVSAGSKTLMLKAAGLEEDGSTAQYTRVAKFVKENYTKLEYDIPMR